MSLIGGTSTIIRSSHFDIETEWWPMEEVPWMSPVTDWNLANGTSSHVLPYYY